MQTVRSRTHLPVRANRTTKKEMKKRRRSISKYPHSKLPIFGMEQHNRSAAVWCCVFPLVMWGPGFNPPRRSFCASLRRVMALRTKWRDAMPEKDVLIAAATLHLPVQCYTIDIISCARWSYVGHAWMRHRTIVRLMVSFSCLRQRLNRARREPKSSTIDEAGRSASIC